MSMNEDNKDIENVEGTGNTENVNEIIPSEKVDAVTESDSKDESVVVDKTEAEIEAEKKAEDEIISKHKIKDKHRLKHDSIFKGKKEDAKSEYDSHTDFGNKQQSFEPSVSSNYSFERENPYEYKRLNELRENVYDIIVYEIKLNIKNSRRKPSKVDFNKYFTILVGNLDMMIYSHSEVFIELAYYFSDNIANMFKLLDEKWGGKISMELAKKHRLNGITNLEDIDFD